MTWTTTNNDMNHHKSPQITINHHKFTMTWITTNHKSLQITTNHDINHHEPWQKPARNMTRIIMMTKKELCLEPYGFLVQFIWGMGQILGEKWYFVQNYLCQFYFNYFAIVVFINKAFKLFKLVLVVYCDSCCHWWYPGNSADQRNI